LFPELMSLLICINLLQGSNENGPWLKINH
jgi:hypothetical protein